MYIELFTTLLYKSSERHEVADYEKIMRYTDGIQCYNIAENTYNNGKHLLQQTKLSLWIIFLQFFITCMSNNRDNIIVKKINEIDLCCQKNINMNYYHCISYGFNWILDQFTDYQAELLLG